MKHKTNNRIKKRETPFNLKPKHLFDEISLEIRLICPELKSIRSHMYRNINEQLQIPDITSYDEVPDESEYYKTKTDEDFMIFKDPNLIIFQSPFQACESYHNYINNYFSNKPYFYRLLYTLKKEVFLSYKNYERRILGMWTEKPRIWRRTDDIEILIKNFRTIESELIYNGCNREMIVKLWYNCLTALNNKKDNL